MFKSALIWDSDVFFLPLKNFNTGKKVIFLKKPFSGGVCQIELQTQGDSSLRAINTVNHPIRFSGRGDYFSSNLINEMLIKLSLCHVTYACWILSHLFFFFFLQQFLPHVLLWAVISKSGKHKQHCSHHIYPSGEKSFVRLSLISLLTVNVHFFIPFCSFNVLHSHFFPCCSMSIFSLTLH